MIHHFPPVTDRLPLIFDLPLRDTLHASRDTKILSTTVESSLQISSFMQNKPNFLDALMNVNSLITVDYEKKTLGERGKTKPIQSQLKPIKANIMPKQSQFKPNSNPIKPNFNSTQKGRKEKLTIDKCVKISENLIGVVKFVIMS